jgi:hypothetical protein
MGHVNHPGNPRPWAIAHENGQKCKNNEFCVMPLKHVLSAMGLVNHLGTPKLWAIAQVMPLKHVLSVIGLVNHPGNPKMWTIAHKNVPITLK